MKKSELEFIEYITKPLSMKHAEQLYRSYNIIPERLELYLDFIESLISLVFDTYPGRDVCNLEDEKNHFNWAWNKVISNFKKENINFDVNDAVLKSYLEAYLGDNFYKNDSEVEKEIYVLFWKQLLSYSQIKTRSDIDSMVDIYKMFERNLFGKTVV